jgi:hypothetical protein
MGLPQKSQIQADSAGCKFNPILKTGLQRDLGSDVDCVGLNVNGF